MDGACSARVGFPSWFVDSGRRTVAETNRRAPSAPCSRCLFTWPGRKCKGRSDGRLRRETLLSSTRPQLSCQTRGLQRLPRQAEQFHSRPGGMGREHGGHKGEGCVGAKRAGEDSQEDVGLPVKTQSTSKSSHPRTHTFSHTRRREIPFPPTRNFLRFDEFRQSSKEVVG